MAKFRFRPTVQKPVKEPTTGAQVPNDLLPRPSDPKALTSQALTPLALAGA